MVRLPHNPPMQWNEPAGKLFWFEIGAAPARPLISLYSARASASMTHPSVNLYDLDRKIVDFPEELILLRPTLRNSPHAYTKCQVAIVVTPDMKRVFVGESEYEFPQVAYEADTLTIEGLAERFDHPELRQALSLRVSQ